MVAATSVHKLDEDKRADIGPGASVRANAPSLLIDLVTDTETVRNDWQLLAADPLNSPHQSLAWCSAWAQTHNRPLMVIRGMAGGIVVFLLPLDLVKTKGVRVARFPGGNFNNINTGLFEAHFAASATDEMAAKIATEIRSLLSGRADLVALQNIPLLWRDRRNPLAALASVENQNHAFQLPILGSFEATLAQVNAKRRRKKFRVQSRRADELGGYSHVIATLPAEKREFLETFFLQKGKRFADHGIPDVFRDPAARAFFHALTEAPGDIEHDVPLELHALQLHGENGGIAAVAGLTRKGDHVICQFGSIDDTVAADVSPGELLFWLMIERACREKAALFDFGVGDQLYKRSWCPVETVQHDIFLPVTMTGRLAAQIYTASAKAKAIVKANPNFYAAIQRLRAKFISQP